MGEAAALSWAALFSLNSIFMRWGGMKVDIFWLNACRTLLACLVLAVLLLAGSGPAGLLGLPQHTVLWLILSTVITYLGDMAFFRSTQYIGVSRGLPIANCYPLVSVVLAITLLGEAWGWRLLLGTGLILAGAYLVARPRRPLPSASLPSGPAAGRLGVSLAAGAAFAWGLGVICDRMAMQGQAIDVVAAALLRLGAGATFLFLLARSRPFKTAWLNLAPGFYLALVLTALVCGAGAPLVWLFAIQQIGAARGGLLAATGPLWGLLLGAFLLREPIARATALGTLLTIAGVWAIL
ncbi:MAG: DMT family transporter [Chloroflexota bacterium]